VRETTGLRAIPTDQSNWPARPSPSIVEQAKSRQVGHDDRVIRAPVLVRVPVGGQPDRASAALEVLARVSYDHLANDRRRVRVGRSISPVHVSLETIDVVASKLPWAVANTAVT
jgi:hypothetical protein